MADGHFQFAAKIQRIDQLPPVRQLTIADDFGHAHRMENFGNNQAILPVLSKFLTVASQIYGPSGKFLSKMFAVSRQANMISTGCRRRVFEEVEYVRRKS